MLWYRIRELLKAYKRTENQLKVAKDRMMNTLYDVYYQNITKSNKYDSYVFIIEGKEYVASIEFKLESVQFNQEWHWGIWKDPVCIGQPREAFRQSREEHTDEIQTNIDWERVRADSVSLS